MASFLSEQADEIEALMSIYPDEFELISSPPSNNSFKICLQPSQIEEENHVKVSLICELPAIYPEVPPILSINPIKGLGNLQIDELKTLSDAKAAENLGMPSIFVVAEAIKEWLVDNNVEGQDGSMYAEMMRRMQSKDVETKKKVEKAAIVAAAESELKVKSEAIDAEEEERLRKRQAGTQVTVETFMQWKIKFEEEMEALALLNGTLEVANLKPTGKQLFLSNSAGLEEALLAASESMDFSNDKEYESSSNYKLGYDGGEGDSDDDSDSDYIGEDGEGGSGDDDDDNDFDDES